MRSWMGLGLALALGACASVPTTDAVGAFATALNGSASTFTQSVQTSVEVREQRLAMAISQRYAHGGVACLSRDLRRADCAWLLTQDDTKDILVASTTAGHEGEIVFTPDMAAWARVRAPVIAVLRDYAAGLELVSSDPARQRVEPALTALSNELKTSADLFAQLSDSSPEWNNESAKTAVSAISAVFDLWFRARRDTIIRETIPRMQPHVLRVSELLAADVALLADRCEADVGAMRNTARFLLGEHQGRGDAVVHGSRSDSESVQAHLDQFRSLYSDVANAEGRCATIRRAVSTFRALPAAHAALSNPQTGLDAPALQRFIENVRAVEALFAEDD